MLFNERVLKVDDPVRRGFGARVLRLVWRRRRWASSPTARTAPAGTASARRPISARPARASPGLLHGDTSQFLLQLGGATLCAVYAFTFTFVVFKVVNAIVPLRVSKEVELEGLDVPEFGMLAYPESGDEVSAAV